MKKNKHICRVFVLLCCALFIMALATACQSTPADVEITAEPTPAPTQTPPPAPSPTAEAAIPATALSPAEINAIEEMVSLSGAFQAKNLDKNAMLLSLRRYVSLGARGVPEDFPTGVSALYDYAADPEFVRRSGDNGPFLMKAEAAAAFIKELYGRELPYPNADYFNESINDWYCRDGEYRLFPQDTGWEIRQESYTIDEKNGVYTLRMQNGASSPGIFAQCERACNRWGFTLLSVKDDTGILFLPASAQQNTPLPQETPQKTPDPDDTEKAPPLPEPTPEALENSPTPGATPSAAPGATATPVSSASASADSSVLKGKIIGIDPGHQTKANRDMESVAPGSDEKKHKVSSGTVGTNTGVREYQINLDVALLLQSELQNAGATVYITRTSNDVDISNIERAQFFNDHKVDLGLRLHCNGSDDAGRYGAFMLVPADKSYPYYAECIKAAKCILQSYGEATGLSTDRGVTYRSDQTGFNWCDRPVTNIEMGHLTNAEDETLLVDPAFQKKMAQGIFNGIVRYFSE